MHFLVKNITSTVHSLNSKDLKALKPRERYVLDCVLNNKTIQSETYWAGPEIYKLKNRLITIKSNSHSPHPKDSCWTKFLNLLGIMTQSQRLFKNSEKVWNRLNPSYAECALALEKAKTPDQIYRAVEFADPLIAGDLIKKAIDQLKNDPEKVKKLEAKIDPLQMKLIPIKKTMTQLADEKKYGELLTQVDQYQGSENFIEIIETALRSLAESQSLDFETDLSSEWNKTRLNLAQLLYQSVEKEKDNPNFDEILKSAEYSLLPYSSSNQEYWKIVVKFEKL